MRTITCLIIAGSVFTFQSLAAQGQDRALSLDVRGAHSFPFGDFGDSVEGDFGFGVGGVFSLTNRIGVYAGWGRDSFDCDLCSDSDKLQVSGFEVGAKVAMPLDGRALPWLKVGLMAHTVSFDSGVVNFESDRKYGVQAAVGLDVPLGRVLSISPSVRVNFLDLDDPGSDTFLDSPEVRYLSLDLGAHIHIPRN
jgi:hypothetical protein